MSNFSKIIFCDTLEALHYLYKNGMPKDTVVITKSPTILSQKYTNVINIENNITNIEREDFRKNSELLIRDLYESIKNINDEKYCVFIAAKFSTFLFDIYNALLIKNSYLSNKFTIVSPEIKNEQLSEAVKNGFERVLSKHKNCEILKVPISVTKERSARGESHVNIFKRFKKVGINGLIWSVINHLSNYKIWYNQNKVGFIFYNELVRGISINFFLKNFKTIVNYKNHINFKIENKNHFNDKDVQKIYEISKPFLDKAIEKVSSNNLKENLHDLWFDVIKREINNYYSYKASIISFFNSNSSLKILLTGYIEPVKGAALYHICKSKNIKLIACQHGVTRELIRQPLLRSINFENSFCDYFLCFNRSAKEITKQSYFHTLNKKVYITGLPKDYFYNSYLSKLYNNKLILYVSTFLLSGGRPNILAAPSDNSMVSWERNFVNNVLEKFNYKVDFKPYPALRYADKDEVIKSVRSSKNICISGSHIDLRYIIQNYKIVITSGATSTFSWCVQSHKPLIFIDRKGPLKLSNKAKKDFDKSFFLFSDENDKWEESLIKFVNRPYSYIKKEWDAKSSDRKRVIRTYFGEKLNLKYSNIISNLLSLN